MIDLRSDTVTRPDAAMYEAMCRADLGDDVFGDDPTVQALEAAAAERLGKESALFVPTGTMGNAAAIGAWSRPGDEILIEAGAHSFNFEAGGGARLWGVQMRPLASEGGRVPLDALESAVRPDDVHCPRTRLLILEQTNNVAGGRILPVDYLDAVREFCRERNLRFHLDGARIFNAAVASGVRVAEYASRADSVMFCLSKGLGAPAGSVIAGPSEFIVECRRLRKVLGGGMRQAGVLAAAGLHALEANVARLADDHARARRFAATLSEAELPGVRVLAPETNMVYLYSPGDPAPLVAEMKADGLLAVNMFGTAVRFVFHKDVDDGEAERAAEIAVRSLRSAL